MSGYEKSPQQTGYDARASQGHQFANQQGYGTYASHQPQFASIAAPVPIQPAHRSLAHEQLQSSALSEVYGSGRYEARPSITAISLTPTAGNEGTIITACIQSGTDFKNSTRSVRLMIGTQRCDTSVSRDESKPNTYQLSSTIPTYQQTRWSGSAVQVSVVVQEADGQQVDSFELGQFTYVESVARPDSSMQSPQRVQRKRKISVDPEEETLSNPTKRAASQPLRPKSGDYYGYASAAAVQYPGYGQSAGRDGSYGLYSSSYSQASEPSQSGAYAVQASPRNIPAPYQSFNTAEPTLPPAPSWGHSTNSTAAVRSSEMPRELNRPNSSIAAAPAADQGLATSSQALDQLANPPLIRTSALQPSGTTNGPGSSGTGSQGTFSPYGLYPHHKATLVIEGDLREMAKRWTPDEWDNRRRLVQFYRNQKGGTVFTTFRPVPVGERPHIPVVSCIWWEEKQQCYVTSVDCISLLEQLIGVKFSVEEKNRIRRNLEGFQPLTVSKNKQDCENIFKRIMAFPPPKPRNIEKDIKVFSWETLAGALKKIFGKYSASYSSTTSVIPPAPNAPAYPGPPPRGESSLSVASDERRDSQQVSSPSVARDRTTSTTSTSSTGIPGTVGESAQRSMPGSTFSALPRVPIEYTAISSLTPHATSSAAWGHGQPSSLRAVRTAWESQSFPESVPASVAVSQPLYFPSRPAISSDDQASSGKQKGPHPSDGSDLP